MPFPLAPVLRQINADEFIHWTHLADLRCVLILLGRCTFFSQVVSFLHTFRSKSFNYVYLMSIRPVTCRARLILPDLITTFIEYGEQHILWRFYYPLLCIFQYLFRRNTMKENFQYRKCIIWNHNIWMSYRAPILINDIISSFESEREEGLRVNRY
jgi:hypothetical protein